MAPGQARAIAPSALRRARERLGPLAARVRWLQADVTPWAPRRRYDLWHDRAVFHLLTRAEQRRAYREALVRALKPGGHVVMTTFAPDGPELPMRRYDAAGLQAELGKGFRLRQEARETHRTPWGGEQRFPYALFRRGAA